MSTWLAFKKTLHLPCPDWTHLWKCLIVLTISISAKASKAKQSQFFFSNPPNDSASWALSVPQFLGYI